MARLAARLVIRWKRVVIQNEPPIQDVKETVVKNKDEPLPTRGDVVITSRDLLNQTGLGGDVMEDVNDKNQDNNELPEVPEYDNHPPLEEDQENVISQDYPDYYEDLEYHYDEYVPEPEPADDIENIPPCTPITPKTSASSLTSRTPVQSRYRTPGQEVSSKTPVQSRYRTPTPVTPLPDYSAMLTPQLRAELNKFGLKAVPRRKACLLLNHIYDQTHPLVPGAPKPTIRQEVVDSNGDDTEEDDEMTASQHMPEESILYNHEDDDDDGIDVLTRVSGATLHEKSRKSLHQMILLYEPIWLGQLHKDVKEAGIKCNMAQLQVKYTYLGQY